MLLCIDAGNTNITLGLFDETGALRFRARLATQRALTADQMAVQFLSLFQLYDCDPGLCQDAMVGSVVAELTQVLCDAAKLLTGKEALLLAPGIKTGLDIRIDNPAQLGADLIATAVAVKAQHPLPCIVADLGTATKLSVISSDGAFLGCTICAGVALSLESLSTQTSLLPRIAFQAPLHTIGTNSIDSMQAGAVFGTACMIDGMVARIERELGANASVIATGGLSADIIPHCTRTIPLNPDLVLQGLREIYLKNFKFK